MDEDRFRKFGPLSADHPLVVKGDTCPGCNNPFVANHFVTLIVIGPGSDKEERMKARTGKPYTAVAIPSHWGCVTGEKDF